jgi:hypothetical protein
MAKFYRLLASVLVFLTFNANATDTYNHLNNQLSIPAVILGDTVYRDVVITVGEVLTVGGSSNDSKYPAKPSTTFDTYDPVTNRLTIPNVNAFGIVYHDVIITVDRVVSVGSTEELIKPAIELGKLVAKNMSVIDLNKAANYNGADILFYNLLGKGDINGDGYEDLVIGLFRHSTYPSYSGRQFDPSGEIKPVVLLYNALTDNYEVDHKLQSVIRANQHPRQVAIADFDGDGRNDVFIADHGYDDAPYGNQNTLLLNKITGYEDGTNLLPQLSDFSHGLVVADFDGNGKPDLLVLNNTVSDKTKCEQYPEFKECFYISPKYSESYVLFNYGINGLKKGILEIPDDVINFKKSNLQRDKRLYVGHSADFNKDGKADLVISDHRNIYILESSVAGIGKFLSAQIFSPPTKCTDSNPYSAIISNDIDGDGIEEIIASNACDLNGAYFQIFKRDQKGIWSDKTNDFVGDQTANFKLSDGWCYKFEIFDLNADGVRDLICQSVRGMGTPTNNILWLRGSKFEFSNVTLQDGNWTGFHTVVKNKDGTYILGFRYQMGKPNLSIFRWKIR